MAGIHDPEMVKSGLTPQFTADATAARFRLANSDVGHAFPTYVTPKVIMIGIALDAEGRSVPGSEREHAPR